MTLDRAIVGLEDLLVDDPHFDPESRREAVKLGIEALKAWKEFRGSGSLMDKMLLPGETED